MKINWDGSLGERHEIGLRVNENQADLIIIPQKQGSMKTQ